VSEARGERRLGDDRAHATPLETIPEILALEQRRRRNDHRTEADRGEHRFPESDAVGQHEEQAIATSDSLRGEKRRKRRRAHGHAGEGYRSIAAGIVDHAQRGGVVAGRDDLEVVADPVELLELWTAY